MKPEEPLGHGLNQMTIQAIEDGFIVGNDEDVREYRRFCFQRGIPFVHVLGKRNTMYRSIEMGIPIRSRNRPTQDEQFIFICNIVALFWQFYWVDYSVGLCFATVRRIPREHVAFVAREMFSIGKKYFTGGYDHA